MGNIWTIAKREYKLYFSTPVAYVVLFLILLFLGIFFYLGLSLAVQRNFAPDVQSTTGLLATLLMLATPAITTRLLAEEQRLGTIELLLTAPVRDAELVVGKWLGAFMFFLTINAISIIFPFVLNSMVKPGIDQGPVISGYLGLALLSAALVAIGVAVSSFFANQIAAFATTLGVLILLWWIVGPIAQAAQPLGAGSEIIAYLDLAEHYFSGLVQGVIDLRDIVYYLSVTALGLFLGTVSVEMRRWR